MERVQHRRQTAAHRRVEPLGEQVHPHAARRPRPHLLGGHLPPTCRALGDDTIYITRPCIEAHERAIRVHEEEQRRRAEIRLQRRRVPHPPSGEVLGRRQPGRTSRRTTLRNTLWSRLLRSAVRCRREPRIAVSAARSSCPQAWQNARRSVSRGSRRRRPRRGWSRDSVRRPSVARADGQGGGTCAGGGDRARSGRHVRCRCGRKRFRRLGWVREAGAYVIPPKDVQRLGRNGRQPRAPTGEPPVNPTPGPHAQSAAASPALVDVVRSRWRKSSNRWGSSVRPASPAITSSARSWLNARRYGRSLVSAS